MVLKQPARVINLQRFQQCELAGEKNADEEKQKRGIEKKTRGCQLLWDVPVVPDSWWLLWLVLVLLPKKANSGN